MSGIKKPDNYLRKLEGDYKSLSNKLIRASYLLSDEERIEVVDALACIQNAINDIRQKVR